MMQNQALRSPVTGLPGWETPAEELRLIALAGEVPAGGCIVEIGAEFGMSAGAFCTGAKPDVQIYSIDLFPDKLLHTHRQNLIKAGFGTKWDVRSMQIKGDSAIVGRRWFDDNMPLIDLLFIDGDHNYSGVKADIEVWTPLVKINGVVVFHDAAPPTNQHPHSLHYDVQRAIEEWVDPLGWQELPPVDTMRVFRRIP